ncbi:hypothetical protein DFH08DRAFT_818660 [Mycena albidolilacea]|uniref:Uncharacterized protein n=1 Tax=Mycena albidolilacea TaxID=1033008 RepID=A0AAD7EFW3_9AGAR|nr:hypothetical protein DFH08DRAFT_818660 [Mycena albidolilacea]
MSTGQSLMSTPRFLGSGCPGNGQMKLIGGGVQAWRRLRVKMSLPYGPMLLAVILSHDATKPMIGPYHPYTAVYGSYGTEKYGSVPYTYGLPHILSDGSRYGGIPVPYVHILTVIIGSKISPNATRHIRVTLDIPHEPSDPVRVLREEIPAHILIWRKGKHVEHEQQEKYGKITRFNEELRRIRENWPQLVPQEGEDLQMPGTDSGGLHSAKSRTRNLIAPQDLYGKLTKGTLFSAQVSLSTYINKEHNPRVMDSKVYHVNVQKATILDKGDGAPWNPPSPDLPSAVPSTPSKRARDPAVESAFDDLSSSKKARTA